MKFFTTIEQRGEQSNKGMYNTSFWKSLSIGLSLKTGNTFSKNTLRKMGMFDHYYLNLNLKL